MTSAGLLLKLSIIRLSIAFNQLKDQMTEMRRLPQKNQLPYALYGAAQVRELDRLAIEQFSIPSLQLMERAGTFSFELLCRKWPDRKSVTVLCGGGNNGGDGYVVARLAHAAGFTVRLLPMVDESQLQGDALANAKACEKLDIDIIASLDAGRDHGVIVDALLGTGLDRQVEGRWAECIAQANAMRTPVLAIDIPSGLNADSGATMGCVVRADATATFIGLKQGLFTGDGPDCCGEIHFDSLDVPAKLYASQILSARRLDWSRAKNLLQTLMPTTHKGSQGHLLIVGGDQGTVGAARLAAEAALRSGAGLVSVATREASCASMIAGRPEIMAQPIEEAQALRGLLKRADSIVVGPGLGQQKWGQSLFDSLSEAKLPVLVDADGLNLLAKQPDRNDNRILTPHPGEAARLLDCSAADIACDRIAAAEEIQKRYGGVIVLKGAGSIICDGSGRPPAICSDGNPGMATAGMGDLLSGVIGSLLAQGYGVASAAEIGVCLHAAAGDLAARDGMRGMIASDLLPALRSLLG
jgi:hydroxyethylthiazole kinase-like uncharacterized protein yjeF